MEEALYPDAEAVHAAFRAFNRWLEEDWGGGYQERIFATPYLSLMDLDQAVAHEALVRGRALLLLLGPHSVPDHVGLHILPE
ncbi:MAG: hypothetical protein VCB99_12495 [Myxococcota bacterium]|jgi:hypothetical protein